MIKVDINNFITETNKIFREVFEKIHEKNELEQQKILDFNNQLKNNLIDKSQFIKSLEENLKNQDDFYLNQFQKLSEDIAQLETASKANIYDLNAKREELDLSKQEILKPFIQTQRKKKNEISHKITVLKKELANIRKEAEGNFAQNEKEFKAEEAELLRRMNIDLERSDEAVKKQYSDFEKAILITNDDSKIKEYQKKINEYRLAGFKEILSLKNKYAFANFENNIQYLKKQEKLNLDNEIVVEEYRLKLKSLEYERMALEDEERYQTMVESFDNEKQIIQYHRDNELDLIEFDHNRYNEIINIRTQVLENNKLQNDEKYQVLRTIHQDINVFDKSQTEIFQEWQINVDENEKYQIYLFFDALKKSISNFKELIIATMTLFYNRKKEINEEIYHNLIILVGDNVYSSDYKYQKTAKIIDQVIDKYQKNQVQLYNKFQKITNQFVINIEREIKNTLTLLSEYFLEERSSCKSLYKEIANILADDKKDYTTVLKMQFSNRDKELAIEKQKIKNDNLKYQEKIRDNQIKIEHDYQDAINNLNNKIKLYNLEYNLKLENDKKDYRGYIKYNKDKIIKLKKAYNEKISKHEKVQHQIYHVSKRANEEEYKQRKKSL